MKLSTRLKNFNEYPFSIYQKKIQAIEKSTNKKVLNFGPGNPDFPPSKKYIKKLQELIKKNDNHYYPGNNTQPEFILALINWYKKRFNVNLNKKEIIPLLGAKDGVSHLALALLDEKDEVLVPDPGYPAYTGSILMTKAKPIYYNLYYKNNFKPNVKELQSKITKKTKFIWINYPSNPLGQTVTKKDLEPLVKFALKNNIWLIYDNAYSEITYGKYKAPSILEIKDAKKVSLEIGSFSKTYSFAGLRIGWASGNNLLIEALKKVKSQIDSGLSLHLQRLATYVLNNPDLKWQEKMLKSYKERASIIIKNIKKIGLKPNKPKGSLYIWAKIPDKYKDSQQFSLEMLEKKQIFLTPGIIFGKNGKRFVRISFCINIKNINSYFS